jgi:etoposide-induced 2.4 mRNA
LITGFPATFITSFGPTLVNMAIFALLYPLVSLPKDTLRVFHPLHTHVQFVIQALQSRPPNPKSSLLPSTPSPHTSAPPSPMTSTIDLASDPFFNSSTPSRSVSRWKAVQRPKLPIFFFARYALDGLRWLEAALLRDRKGSSVRRWEERAGRRLN